MAIRGRDACYHLVTTLERIAGRQRDALLPPAHLRKYYYRTWNPKAFTHACDTVRTELILHGLRPEHRILDIGSGIGNLALGLVDYLDGSYEGIEIHREAAAWCQQAITARYPRFRFHHADVASSAYNRSGRVVPSAYRFPFPDRDFDVVFLGSVFTHMLPDSVEHYMHEVSRLLRPDGVCVASYFLLNDSTRAAVDAGHSFLSFPEQHASGLCRLHDAMTPEAAIALDEVFVRHLYEAAGLSIRDIRRGGWWTGRADDQDVVAATLLDRHSTLPINSVVGAD